MQTKHLYKSRSNRMLAGVCGGVAEYFNIDPTVVRLITIVLVFITAFFGVAVAYAICAAVVPERP